MTNLDEHGLFYVKSEIRNVTQENQAPSSKQRCKIWFPKGFDIFPLCEPFWKSEAHKKEITFSVTGANVAV